MQAKGRKIGYVRVHELSAGFYRFGWRDTGSGKYIRRRVYASTPAQMRKAAEHVNTQIQVNRGFIPGARDDNHSLIDAFILTINHSRGSARTKLDYKYLADAFLSWARLNHKAVRYWGDLRPLHLTQYVKDLEASPASFRTIQKRLLIVRMASLFMAENFPELYHDIAKKARPTKPQTRTDAVSLEWGAVLALLEYAEENDLRMFPILMLQALCGLRIYEVIHLRGMDVNPAALSVAITETPHHKPKTKSSNRTIPIPVCVLRAIEPYIPTKPEDYLFRSLRRGLKMQNRARPYSYWGIGRRLKQTFERAAAATNRPELKGFMPRKLRATFATLARRAGVPDMEKKKYMGHAPESVMESNYEAITLEDLRARVVEFIDAELQKQKTPLA